MAFEIVGAIGGVTQGVARLLGLSKSARLRRSISDHIKLYVSMEGRSELSQAAADVAGLINVQTRQLVLREVIAANRTYDWTNFAAAIFVTAAFAFPLPLWLIPPHSWWQWVLAILLGFFALIFFLIGLTTTRKQPTVEELTAAANEVEAESQARLEAASD